MNLRKFVNSLKKSHKTTVVKQEENIKNPFIFKYNSICPAISIICLNKRVLNTPERFLWLSELFNLFNRSMITDIYKINEEDLINPNQWFNTTFGHDLFYNANEMSNNPVLWGKYIWSLLHIVSLFWTSETNSRIVFLLENVNYILPCQDCQKHYIDLIKNNNDKITNLSSSVNFVINLREIIGKNKKIYNRVPDTGEFSFVEIYNYILPLVEPDVENSNKSEYSLIGHAICNCKNKKK